MTDIALFQNATDFAIDIAPSGLDLAADNGLRTAVLISLFTDARAHDDDVIPDGTTRRRGWWGDRVRPGAGTTRYPDRIGSRLWLLSREKQESSVLVRARQYAAEALQWLVDDGVAARVEVAAEIVRAGVLGLSVSITRPDGSAERHRFDHVWSNL